MSGKTLETDSDATTCDSAEWIDDRAHLSVDDDLREAHARLSKPLNKFPSSSSSVTSAASESTSLRRGRVQGKPGGTSSSLRVKQESEDRVKPSFCATDFKQKWTTETVSDESDDISCPPSKKEEPVTTSTQPQGLTEKPSVPNKRKGNVRSVRKTTKNEVSKKRKTATNKTQSSNRTQSSTVRKRVARGMQFEDDFPPLQIDSVKPRDLCIAHRLQSSSSSDDDTVGHRLLRSRKRVPKDAKDAGGEVKSKKYESEQSLKVERKESQIASVQQSQANIPTDVMDVEYSLGHEAVSDHFVASHQLIDELFGEEPSSPLTSDLEMATRKSSQAVENPRPHHGKVSSPDVNSKDSGITTPTTTCTKMSGGTNVEVKSSTVAQVKSNSITNPVESQDLVDLDAELFGF